MRSRSSTSSSPAIFLKERSQHSAILMGYGYTYTCTVHTVQTGGIEHVTSHAPPSMTSWQSLLRFAYVAFICGQKNLRSQSTIKDLEVTREVRTYHVEASPVLHWPSKVVERSVSLYKCTKNSNQTSSTTALCSPRGSCRTLALQASFNLPVRLLFLDTELWLAMACQSIIKTPN